MQTLIQVFCTKGPSLRDAIGDDDDRLASWDLYVVEQLRPGRRRGWSKLRSVEPEVHGAINVQWDAAARVLVCRVVTRGTRPAPIVGDFVGYLLSRFRRRILAMSIVP